jgi:hypothetical protein
MVANLIEKHGEVLMCGVWHVWSMAMRYQSVCSLIMSQLLGETWARKEVQLCYMVDQDVDFWMSSLIF